MSATAFTSDTTEMTRDFFASSSAASAVPEQKLDQEDIVFSTDADFNFMRILPFAQQFFSLSQEQGEGRSVLSLLDTTMLPAAVDEIKVVLATQSYWRGIVPFKLNGQVVWKDTFVRPIFRKSRVVGTQWMLTNPDDDLVARAKAVYTKTLNTSVLGAAAMAVAFLALLVLSFASLPSGLHPLLVVLATLVGYGGRRFIGLNKVGANDELESKHFPIQRKVFAKTSATELVDYELALKQGALSAAMSRIEAGTNDLSEALDDTRKNAEQLASSAEELAVTSEQVSSASEQMTISVEEISQSASATADECKGAKETVNASAEMIDEASDNVKELASYIAKSADATSALVEKSESARKVSERIDSIAEQTNLLALNAAIEAARAGDSGRGFSVVADEVRALSQSTQQAVDEIEDTINAMAESINTWQSEMSQQVDLAERCNRYSERSKSEMLSMRETIASISEHMQQVAAASAQNQQALTEVNEAIQQSKQATRGISEGAAETFESVSGVGHRIREFRSISTALEEE